MLTVIKYAGYWLLRKFGGHTTMLLAGFVCGMKSYVIWVLGCSSRYLRSAVSVYFSAEKLGHSRTYRGGGLDELADMMSDEPSSYIEPSSAGENVRVTGWPDSAALL